MAELKFPYEHIGKTRFGPVLLPTVKIDFKVNESSLSVWMIADTGADKTTIPRYLASELNIDLEKSTIKDKTFGIGGEMPVYVLKHKYPIQLGKWKLSIPLAILDSDNVPPLLGRLGFIEKFNFCFTNKAELIITK